MPLRTLWPNALNAYGPSAWLMRRSFVLNSQDSMTIPGVFGDRSGVISTEPVRDIKRWCHIFLEQPLVSPAHSMRAARGEGVVCVWYVREGPSKRCGSEIVL